MPNRIVYELWAYESFDEAIAVNEKAQLDEEWRDTGNEVFIDRMYRH